MIYRCKMGLTEENNERKVFLTLEEAHGFVSRDKQGHTLYQLGSDRPPRS